MPPAAVTTAAPPIVGSRLLLAEGAASAALALVQCPALWAGLQTVALMQDAAGEYQTAGELGSALASLLACAMTSNQEINTAVRLVRQPTPPPAPGPSSPTPRPACRSSLWPTSAPSDEQPHPDPPAPGRAANHHPNRRSHRP